MIQWGLFRFASSWWLLGLFVIPLVYFIARWLKGRGAVRYSNVSFFSGAPQSGRARAAKMIEIFLYLSILAFVVALSRPQAGTVKEKSYTKGVDIVLALDISTSMRAVDFKPKNRIEAAKEVAAEFIKGQENNRIGLVIFAAEAFTQCPLTIDYGMVLNFLQQVHIGQIEDGTAIGMGLATAARRLMNSEAKSKVVILLTDGRNNRGEIDPQTAAMACKALGIRVYTIGMGKPGEALYPVDDPIFGRRYVPMPVEIDEGTLMRIANATGGNYFRATDTDKLKQIFKEIDEMEKTKIKVTRFTKYRELGQYAIALGLLLLALYLFLINTTYRRLP